MRASPVRIALLIAANLLGLAAFLWPFLLPAATGDAHEIDAPFIVIGLVACLGLLLFVELGRGGMGPKAVALIGVLGAAMVALRLPGFIAGFSAMFIIVLVAGNAFGPGFGFVLGAVGTFASGLFIGGIGPWLPFQMVAVGWVGMGAGLIGRPSNWRIRIALLALYGAFSGFAFGWIMNLWFWPFASGSSTLGWDAAATATTNLRHYAAFYLATSGVWDLFRAIGNAALVVAIGKPLLVTLDRAASRMRLDVLPEVIITTEESAGWLRPGPGDRSRVEESPGSIGQDAGEIPRRGDPWTVQQKANRHRREPAVRVKR